MDFNNKLIIVYKFIDIDNKHIAISELFDGDKYSITGTYIYNL